MQDANQKTLDSWAARTATMDITLPAKLKQFVETQVKNGGYADEVTATAGIRVASST